MVFTPDEVLVYDGDIQPTKIPVRKGWRDKITGLWQIPLTNDITNVNRQTKLLQCDEMIQAFHKRTLSVYTLPSKADVVTYLHAALGFPTKGTLLAATRAGYLTSWPGLTTTVINKHFPESFKTQTGHMNHQRQGIRSMKTPQLQPGVEADKIALDMEMKTLKQKHRDIYIHVYEEKELVYAATKRENSQPLPAGATNTSWYYTTSMEVKS
jgi:hypothetical protein